MDLVAGARAKLAHFRIKELKDVLRQLSLIKQGKKQDLVDRISTLLSDEKGLSSVGIGTVVKIIDDIYRKMQDSSATDLESRSHSSSDLNCLKVKVEVDDTCQLEMKVRCLCGSSLITDSMIKCEDHKCQVWQHIGCVMASEKHMEGSQPELPSLFYCELCRLNRADPFWLTVRHPVLPLKMTHGTASDRTNVIQNVEKTFTLSRSDRELLQRTDYDLQVWCMLLNDQVYYRMHWPLYSELVVNGVQIRTTGRLGQQLGINGRDDGPLLKTCTKEGINNIFLSCSDDRVFCCGIRLVRRLTLQQILNMIPRESEGESLEDALARVCRCVGGNATENADSDSDIEVVADSVTVNLRCPMSGSRMRIAGRFKGCLHMGCFDLETFIELNQRSRKWQCPTCSKNYSLEGIIIDPYFNRVTSLMQNFGEDVSMIEVRADGSWRAKNEGECRDNDLCRWHLPDGSLCSMTNDDVKTKYEMFRQLKQAVVPEGNTGLKFDLRRKGNGIWEVSKADCWSPSSGNNVHEKSENQWQKIKPVSSSATGSYKDGEDASVNQGVAQFEIYTSIGPDLDSFKDFFDQTFNVDHRVTPAPRDANIIFLSDSDEERIPTIPQTIYNSVPNPCSAGTTLSVSDPTVPADLGLSTSGTSFHGFFNSNFHDFGLPLWAMQSSPTEFQLFHSDGSVPDALIDEQSSLNCAPTDVSGLIQDDLLNVLHENNTLFTSSADLNGGLVDNPLAYGNDDPSLKIFLPTGPDSEPLHQDMREHPKLSNGGHADDWTSLTLAAGGAQTDNALAFGLNSGNQILPSENGSVTFDMDSLFLTRNNQKGNKATLNTQRSDSSFSHPHQPRSVRPRMCFSIDVDSDSQ